MMSGESNPWSGLSIPSKPNSYSSRRVSILTEHNFYWAKNDVGQCCLIFSCDLDKKLKIDEVKLKGISLEQHISNKPEFSLIVKLTDDTSRDIFRTICNDLVASTKAIDSTKSATVVSALNARLKRWQELLSKKKSELLSNSEQLGLFGELSILRDCLLKSFRPVTAVASWRGPLGSEQDFGVGGCLVEVKSQISTSDSKVQINSLEQLDDISGNVWLVHQAFSASEVQTGNSMTLNEIVSEISFELSSDIFALDQFRILLIEIGYEKHQAYSEIAYELTQRSFFRANENFPRLKRSVVPSQIISAKYFIDISSISHLNIPENEFLSEICQNE